jgi:hypothetical protein
MTEERLKRPRFLEIRRGRATVRCETGALARAEAAAFAALAARGIREVERLMNCRGRATLLFEVSGDGRISMTRGRTIHLSAHRVRSLSAPYLHEIAHVLFPCPHAPEWFGEGLACYLEAAVAERGGGYDSRLFTSDGNRGVDGDAQQWLADPRGQAVLRFVGRHGMPRDIVRERSNVAAPYYVFSHSLVKFLAEKVGVELIVRVSRARGFGAALERTTGKSGAAWRNEWLANVGAIAEKP